MQEKKIDYSPIIGISLISLILVLYFYFNPITSPVEEKKSYESQSTKDLVEKQVNQEKQEKVTSTLLKEEIQSVLENDFLQLKISSKGGQISEVLLKNYKAYDPKTSAHTKDLFLVKNGSALFSLQFSSNSDKILDTKNLYFVPLLTKKKGEQILELKAKLPKGKTLTYTYILPSKSYKLEFSVFSDQLNLEKPIELHFSQKAFSFEKQQTWENNYTQMYFSYDKKNKVKYLSEGNQDKEEVENLDWIANKQQFFSSILAFKSPLKKALISSKSLDLKDQLKEFDLKAELASQNGKLDLKAAWHFSPLDYKLLKAQGEKFEDIIPFGWGILKWVNKYFFLLIFNFLEKTDLSYGIIIILMTLVVKIALSPITYRQYKLSAMMKIIRPELQELNEKHKKSDPLKKQQATMELYRKTGVNPMSGCLPALLQIPIFYALFKFFPTMINLRGKSFLWAEDLTSYDSIYQLSFSIPLYGDHVSLFTILYAGALLLYSKVSGSSNMSAPTSEGMPDMRFMTYLMPIMMLLFINNYASGLSLYYFVSNILNIALIFIIKKFIINEKAIHRKIQENKAKPAKKTGKFQQRLQEMMKEAQKRRELNK